VIKSHIIYECVKYWINKRGDSYTWGLVILGGDGASSSLAGMKHWYVVALVTFGLLNKWY